MVIQRTITAVGPSADAASPLPPVIPVMCPEKSRVSHTENTALKATEFEQRALGPSQFMLLDAIYLPQRTLKICV